MTLTTLVAGANALAREAAIAAAIDQDVHTTVILEGLPNGVAPLDHVADCSSVAVFRIAVGCLCCTGNLTLRVTLNRILRYPPMRLYISLSALSHLEQIRHFLTRTPYDTLLTLTDDLRI